MKVLHLNTFDIEGGAARAAWRLHQGLKSLGTDSRMLVQTKTSADTSVVERDSELARGLGKLRPYAEILPLILYRGRPPTHWATEWLPTRIIRQIDAMAPDLIHLHWICRGFMSIADIGNLSSQLRTPLVWTLHDSWAFTGGCHVPGSCPLYKKQCGKCPQLASIEEDDLSRWTWERKQRAWKDANITVIAPSRWLGDCARSSTLFAERRIEVIPNSIDSRQYCGIPRLEARAALGLPKDRKLILISAMNATHDINKGFKHLESALRQLAAEGWQEHLELLVVGQPAPPTPVNTGVPTRFLGVLPDDHSMRQVYSAADVTVLPSLQENLPNSIMESMACGTPVVAFGIGGIPQLVEHGVTGYLARATDSSDLAAGLREILTSDTRRDQFGSASRLKIEREFDTALITQRTLSLYENLVTRG